MYVTVDCRTLWMGDLAYWMDENFIFSLFLPTGALQTVKIIRNKASNASEGYGFVEFTTHAAAEDVLQTLNGTPIPNTDQIFRLNWAAFGVGKQTYEGTDNSMLPGASDVSGVQTAGYNLMLLSAAVHVDHSIFVGDLAPEVTDYMLQEHFRQYYPSVRSAKVSCSLSGSTQESAALGAAIASSAQQSKHTACSAPGAHNLSQCALCSGCCVLASCS